MGAMEINEGGKLIFAFIKDIFFASKVESVAEKLGYRVRWIERAERIAPTNPNAPERQPMCLVSVGWLL